MRSNQHFRLRVLQHIAQSLIRIFEIEWCIGSTGLMDRQHCQRELLETVEHHAYEVVGLYAKLNQLAGQRIRVAVHLTVGQLAVPVHHSRSIGCAFGLLCEEVGKGLAQVNVNLLARTYLDNTLSLLVAHDADTCQSGIGFGDHSLYCHLHSICKALHQMGRILTIIVLHTDTCLSINVTDKEGDGELRHFEFQAL